MKTAAFPRTFPFALFMAFIGLDEGLRFLAGRGVLCFPSQATYYLYPVKALSVAAVLLLFLPRYHEINLRDLKTTGQTTVSVLTGLVVFILWINMDWRFGTLGTPHGFNPDLLPKGFARTLLTMTRLFGAVIVVPVMEELFWRSFLVRYIVDPDFTKVPIGRFTWPSFIISTALFGLEHNFFLAGMMAGAAYNLLLYSTKSISQCVLAHAVTNLALGVYVIVTGKWFFW
jgi:CAAX prenyl protease-like protein